MEQDQSAPIVALSLGCSAIFLLGGAHRSQVPGKAPTSVGLTVLCTLILLWQLLRTHELL